MVPISPVIAQRMAALNVPTAAILRHARLPADLLTSGEASLNAAQWLALWQAVEACVDDPEFGLKAARALAGEPQDVLTITALSAGTLDAALTKIAKFKRVFAFEDLFLVRGPDTCTLRVDTTLPGERLPRTLVDLAFAHILDLAGRGTRTDIVPLAVRFRREEEHRILYEGFFRCRVEFNADNDELVLSRRDLERPLLTSNATLSSYLEKGLEEELSSQSFRGQVAVLVQARLAGQCPTAPQVARELGVSTRTLRRKLQDEASSFQEVLQTVRHSLARTYLRRPELGLKEITFLMGYDDVSSFQRAFRGWEGRPPGAWRESAGLLSGFG